VKILRRVLFVFVALVLMVTAHTIFLRRGRYTEMMEAFSRQQHNSIDVLAVGSSHMYCTLCPAELYRATGLSSFLLSTQRQPIEVSYEYIRRALECHRCKVVILETFMFVYMADKDKVEEGVAHDGLDPLPFDEHKIQTVLNMRLTEGLESFLIPFLKYHARWRNLQKRDFILESSIDKALACRGFHILAQSEANSEVSKIHTKECQSVPIGDYYIGWLERINRIIKAADAELLLLTAPYTLSDTDRGMYSYLSKYATEHGIKCLDMNSEYSSLGIDSQADFYDSSHLNVYGAIKATRRIGRYLKENFQFEQNDSEERSKEWCQICERFDFYKEQEIKKILDAKR